MKNKMEAISQNISFLSDDFKIRVLDKSSDITERAFHSAIEIKLFYEGRSIQMIGGKTVVANAGDITVVNPYEIHTNIETDVYKARYYLLLVGLDFFKNTNLISAKLQNLVIAGEMSFHNHIKQNDRLNKIIKRIVLESQEKKEYYQEIIHNLMEEFFLLLLRDELTVSQAEILTAEKIKKAKLIAPAITKILNDFNRTITIDELAELCHISKYHFCRVFKQVTDLTPTGYIMNYRIHLAQAMLEDKSKSIKQIAAECGYNDISYFYRCYKKIMGIPLNR